MRSSVPPALRAPEARRSSSTAVGTSPRTSDTRAAISRASNSCARQPMPANSSATRSARLRSDGVNRPARSSARNAT